MFFTTTDGNFRLKGSAAGTDFFEIGSSGTSNNGKLDFVIGDDGDEPIVFSKYNYSPAGNVEMMRMQGTGLNNNVRIGINTSGATADAELQVVGTTHTNSLQVGTTSTTVSGIFRESVASGNVTVVKNTLGTTTKTFTFTTLTGLLTTATVMVSPSTALTSGAAIAYVRVTATNQVEIGFINSTGSSVTVNNTFNFTIIQ
jgi:hypothetical protein